ncbi:MAG: phosphoribosylamine--glycine ligase [Planctomycetia bacterium]
MKVLVVGSGGREHALCQALRKSPRLTRLWCAPGNGGIAQVATCLPELQATDIDGLLEFARREQVDLTVVGPEVPLVGGLADRFEAERLKVFGPRRDAAQLEGSKAFAKDFMHRHNIPTAAYREFSDVQEALHHVTHAEAYPLVVKADGLAAGKGVTVCETTAEAVAAVEACMRQRQFGDAGAKVVIEEFLRGEEASVHVVTDGETLVVLPTAQDHKRIGEGDTGKNTGGMGAYSPAPIAEGPALDKVLHKILIPTIDGLKRDGIVFRGVLFAGLMFTKGGARVLEFNCRFGDPETEVILPRLKTDVLSLLELAAAGRLKDLPALEVDEQAAVGVVLASAGYPDAYASGKVIHGLDDAGRLPGVTVYHAGTRAKDDGVVTSGGRVLCVTALGAGHGEARDRAYAAVDSIRFEGAYARRDIAMRALRTPGPVRGGGPRA